MCFKKVFKIMAFALAFPWAVMACADENGINTYDGARVTQSGFSSYSGGSASDMELDDGSQVFYADTLTLVFPDGSKKIFRSVYYGVTSGGTFWTSHNNFQYVAPPITPEYKAFGSETYTYLCLPYQSNYPLRGHSYSIWDNILALPPRQEYHLVPYDQIIDHDYDVWALVFANNLYDFNHFEPHGSTDCEVNNKFYYGIWHDCECVLIGHCPADFFGPRHDFGPDKLVYVIQFSRPLAVCTLVDHKEVRFHQLESSKIDWSKVTFYE